MCVCVCGGGGRGQGGTPPFGLYMGMVCAAPKDIVFEPFWSEFGINLGHFGQTLVLNWVYIFRRYRT